MSYALIDAMDFGFVFQYFYSVKDISVGGQCICYGHALECQKQTDSDVSCFLRLLNLLFEPPHGKTNNLHRRKQRRRSASRLLLS